MNACETFYDPSKSVLQMLQMLANAVADLTNMLRMKLECKIWPSNLHNTYCGCFNLSYICQALSNNFFKSTFALHSAEMSIRMQAKLNERHTITYKRVPITTNVLLSIRMTYDCLRMCCVRILGACF